MENAHNIEIDLYSPVQLRELDRLAALQPEVGSSLTLMERAGEAAYREMRRRWPEARRIAVVCGHGNNAGDGYVLARLARAEGLTVELLELAAPDRLRGDALTVAQRYRENGAVSAFTPEKLREADLIVDALFGTGLDRPVSGRWLDAIQAINCASQPVMALDVPSGLHAGTGTVLGEAVHADVTMTFIGLKTGLYTGAGAACRGQVVLDSLGVPRELYAQVPATARMLHSGDIAAALPRRRPDAHKGHFGHVLVVGGDHGMGGAVRMAAEASMRVGAGLVSVATRADHLTAILSARPELMCRAVDAAEELMPLVERASVIVVGPGLGTGSWGKTLFEAVLASDKPLIVDADALNLLAQAPRRRPNWVLTPHPGEAARLLRMDTATLQLDRVRSAGTIARDYGGVTVLKGSGTIVQEEAGLPQICAAGNPGMASGGMGDVLSGVIGGLLAQGLEPERAAAVGVQAHAAAADQAARGGQRGMLALDLMPFLRSQVNQS